MTKLFSFDVDLILAKDFEMSIVNMFDGTSCPNAHLSSYIIAMKTKGGTQDIAARFFQFLVDSALQSYSIHDHNNMKNWEKSLQSLFEAI